MDTQTTPADLLTLTDPGWSVAVAPRALRRMWRCGRRRDPLETAGALWAVPDGRNVTIVLASGPGPRGENRLRTCLPDGSFYNRWYDRLDGWGGLFFCGQWHTHPYENEPVPSHHDIHGHPGYSDSQGWIRWDREALGGVGHFEAIMAREMTRVWAAYGDGMVYLVAELPWGLNAAHPR